MIAGGRELCADADTGRPAADLERQWDALSAKFFALASPVIGRERAERLRDAIDGIETATSVREIIALARAGGFVKERMLAAMRRGERRRRVRARGAHVGCRRRVRGRRRTRCG